MNVVITIDGREAIPVRAIAWATSYCLSQGIVARDLARSKVDDWEPKLENATAYYLCGNGEVRAMAPREWDTVVRDLSALDEDLKVANLPKLESGRQWKIRATEILPGGTFLWLDEFEFAYESGYGNWPVPMTGSEEGGYVSLAREGDREYTRNPIVPECLEPTILEGFEHFLHQPASESAAPVAQPPQADPEPAPGGTRNRPPTDPKLLGTIAALLAAWPGGKLPSGKELEGAARSVGVSITDDTIRKAIDAAKDAAAYWPK